MSVVQLECVTQRSSVICRHAREFYKNETGEPPIFWIFDSEILPPEKKFAQRSYENNDPCHYDVDNVSNNKLWKLFKKVHWSQFMICDNGNFRPLTQDDIKAFA
jgi:hypothetical protein